MCFHSFFIFIGGYALDWVRMNDSVQFDRRTTRGDCTWDTFKIRRQLGNVYTFFVSMKVRKDYLSAPPVREKYNIGMYMLVPVY